VKSRIPSSAFCSVLSFCQLSVKRASQEGVLELTGPLRSGEHYLNKRHSREKEDKALLAEFNR
jgi:hypothetical protein